jgi:signal peptidase II
VNLAGKGLGRALAVAAIALMLDQLSKIFVRSQIDAGDRIDLVLGVDLVRVSNDGIAFGLLDHTGDWVILLAAVAFAVLIGYFLAVADRPGLWLPLGLLAGGALGNLVDRITQGSVTDFIDPPRWPAFNVADIEITTGVLVLILLFLRDPEAEGERSDGGDERQAGNVDQEEQGDGAGEDGQIDRVDRSEGGNPGHGRRQGRT